MRWVLFLLYYFTANLLDLASSAPAPKEKLVTDMLRCNDLFKWNYEYEKSYWFDTSAMNDRNKTSSSSEQQERSSSSSSTASSSSPRGSSSSGSSSCGSSPKQHHHLQQNDLIIPREPTTSDSFSIKAFMNTTIKPAGDDTDGDTAAVVAGTGVDLLKTEQQVQQQPYQLQKLCSITATTTGDDNEDQLSILFE